MDMTIPAIILFGCMFAGFAMFPSIIRDSKIVIKEVIEEFLEECNDVEMS